LNIRPHSVKVGENSQLMDFYVVENNEKFVVSDKYLANEHRVGEYRIKLAADSMTEAKANIKKYGNKLPYAYAQYGYCLTAHRMQGSQWNQVLVMVENSVMNDYRWVYTAFSRASKELYVCLN
jgi:hypothetical protein